MIVSLRRRNGAPLKKINIQNNKESKINKRLIKEHIIM